MQLWGVEGSGSLAAVGLGPKLAFESPVSALGCPNPLGSTSGLAPKCRIRLSFQRWLFPLWLCGQCRVMGWELSQCQNLAG